MLPEPTAWLIKVSSALLYPIIMEYAKRLIVMLPKPIADNMGLSPMCPIETTLSISWSASMQNVKIDGTIRCAIMIDLYHIVSVGYKSNSVIFFDSLSGYDSSSSDGIFMKSSSIVSILYRVFYLCNSPKCIIMFFIIWIKGNNLGVCK